MASGVSAHNTALEQIFDPFQTGTTPAANSNINGNGSDLSTQFANIIYGTQAAATGIFTTVGGVKVDINTLYAAKGTAQYSLPIQGQSYHQSVLLAHASSGNSTLTFGVFNGTWSVVGGGGGGTLTPAASTRASGSIPAGSVNVQYTAALVSNSGSPASTVTNGASARTAVSSNPTVIVATSGTGSSPGNVGTYNMTVAFFGSAGNAISTTTFTFAVEYDGSA